MDTPKEAELLPIPERLWEIRGTDICELVWLARHPKNPRYAIYIDQTTDMPVRVFLKHAQEELMYEPSLEAAQKTLRRQLLAIVRDLPASGDFHRILVSKFEPGQRPCLSVLKDRKGLVGVEETFEETAATLLIPVGSGEPLDIYITF